jgi:micrococcal nuclease
VTSHNWWHFWSAEPWKAWWRRRPPWREFRKEASRLDSLIAQRTSRLTATTDELAVARQHFAWAKELRPQEIPAKIARAETALAAIPGVSLLETRKREGNHVWTPVDHGYVYLTDRQAIFSGSKSVKFRYDKIVSKEITANGLFLDTSARKRSHILGGPAEKIAVLITASEAVGRGEAATAPFEARAESLRRTAEDIEMQLDRIRAERLALVAPPRPISPAWVPATLVASLVLGVGAIAGPDNSEVTAAGVTTTTLAAQTSTTSPTPTTTTAPTTTTSSLPTTTLLLVANGDIIFAPPASGASGDPDSPLPNAAEVVSVVSVTDGDTLQVEFADGTVEPVRLIGVNSPDTNECWDDEAGTALASLIPLDSEIGITTDVSDRDEFDRLLRYVWAGGMSVNEEMVRRGAAIARRYAPDTAMSERLETAQTEGKEAQLGLWAPDACGPPADADLVVAHVAFDAPGDDNANLNGEWLRIQNSGRNLVDMTGWGIRDESSSNRFEFPPSFSLAPGEQAIIHSGCGDDFGTILFWCSVGSAVWNNDGDTAFLTEPNGNTHHDLSYQGTTTTTTSTTTTTTAPSSSGGGGGSECHPSYEGACVPVGVSDVDCAGGSGDGPYYVGRVTVVGPDPYRLDHDNDGVGCESS